MKKSIFVFISVCLLLTIACSDNKHYDDILLRAEGLMKTNPDSSLAILNAADSLTPNFSLKQKMKYELLLTNAQNKTDVVFTSDSTAKLLVDYYDKHGTANEKMMANYLLGRAYMDMKKWSVALLCFKDAINDADTASSDCDYYTLCLIHLQSSAIYDMQFISRKELESLILGEKYAWMAKDTFTAINAYCQRTSVYSYLNENDSVLSISNKSAHLFMKYGYKKEAAMMIGTMTDFLIRKGEYAKAKKCIDYYETYSGRFDSKGNIFKGYETFYYTLGTYYMNTGKPDSAEYYFRKELREGKDENNQNAGSRGLSLLFYKTHKPDSAAKYAIRAYEINDSAYSENVANNLMQIQSAYDYSHQQQIAENEKIKRSQADVRSFFLVIVIMMLALIFYLVKKKRDANEAYREELYHRNVETIKQAEVDLIMLRSLEKTKLNEIIKEKVSLIEQLSEENKRYRKMYKDNDNKAVINDADIYNRFKTYLTINATKSPTDKDWEDLRVWANRALPNLYPYLSSKNPLNNAEYEICILTRLGFSPSEISALKGYDKSSISTARRRIVEKITGEEGSAKMLDEIVKGN